MILRQSMVKQLKHSNGDWNVQLIRELFSQESVRDICRVFWASNDEKDKLLWMGNKNGSK